MIHAEPENETSHNTPKSSIRVSEGEINESLSCDGFDMISSEIQKRLSEIGLTLSLKTFRTALCGAMVEHGVSVE